MHFMVFGRPIWGTQACPLLAGHAKIDQLTRWMNSWSQEMWGILKWLLITFMCLSMDKRCVCGCTYLSNRREGNSGDTKKKTGLQNCQILGQLISWCNLIHSIYPKYTSNKPNCRGAAIARWLAWVWIPPLPLPGEWPWTSHLNSLRLHFLKCIMLIMLVPKSWNIWRINEIQNPMRNLQILGCPEHHQNHFFYSMTN